MKVLFVFSIGKLHGGAAAVWMNLLDGLAKRGVEPYVVIPQNVDGSLAKALDERGVRWYRAFFTWWVTGDAHPHSLAHRMRRRLAKRVNARADRAIGNIIDDNGIDLVYICDGTVTAGLEEAKKRNIPVVWHFHQFIRDSRSGASFIDPEAHVGATLARADAIITVSKSIKTDLRARFPGCKNTKAIYNGIREDSYYDKSGIFDGDEVVFTLVGRFDANKGQADALEAFLRVAPDYPQARLHFVGTGDEELTARLEKQRDESPCADQVEFMGHRDDMPQVWNETDVALNCSYSEGCSMAVAEAMSSGCLMLCSTAEGNVEIIDGRYGVLYERNRPDALAEKMRWVLDHPEEARSIAALGKRRALRLFNLDRQVDAVYRVFEEVLR